MTFAVGYLLIATMLLARGEPGGALGFALAGLLRLWLTRQRQVQRG